jgi:hypothetical protein
LPQQNWEVGQFEIEHGGVPHVPALQYGCAPPQMVPQPLQLLMSFPS